MRTRYKLLQNNLANKPLLSVFISHDNIYAQVQHEGKTLVACSTLTVEGSRKKTNKSFASLIGKQIAEKALKQNIATVIFNRGYRKFNPVGKLGAFVNSARDAGLCI